jgi:hypothetical protein
MMFQYCRLLGFVASAAPSAEHFGQRCPDLSLLLFYCSPSAERLLVTIETTTDVEEMPPRRQLPVDRRRQTTSRVVG